MKGKTRIKLGEFELECEGYVSIPNPIVKKFVWSFLGAVATKIIGVLGGLVASFMLSLF